MTDYTDLKSIAEVCQGHQPLRFMRSHGALYIRNDNGIVFDVHQNRSFPDFMAQNKDYADLVLAANPAAVLALIAENERIKARLCVCRDCGGQGEIYSGHSSYQGYNQPPEPDMDVCGTCGGDGVLGPLEDFESLAGERDQLKADNEALRDHLRLRVSAMPRDRLRETFNAAYYGPRELGSDGEQCRAGVLAVIDAAMGKGEQS